MLFGPTAHTRLVTLCIYSETKSDDWAVVKGGRGRREGAGR